MKLIPTTQLARHIILNTAILIGLFVASFQTAIAGDNPNNPCEAEHFKCLMRCENPGIGRAKFVPDCKRICETNYTDCTAPASSK